MPKNRLLLIGLSIVLAGLVVIFLAPFFVSNGLRLWVFWQARRQGLKVELEKINAPFLRPIAIQRVHIVNADASASRIEITADRVIVDLNLARIMTGAGAIHTLSMEGVRAELRRDSSGEAVKSRLNWATLQKLSPSNFTFGHLDLRIENGATVILLRNASLSGSEIEAGRFDAGEFTVASPWFRRTFAGLRGATKWQDNRLTLGGITLTAGLDLQLMTADLSHLGKERADLQFDLDAFGGKIRVSFADEWRAQRSKWSVAGAANNISLAQTSEAIGFTDRLGGSLRACNFTFRGDTHDVTHGTASVWMELAGLSWHDRTADVIMLGAALYNRQIQLQQFYVKQRKNQLTMSGEGSLPAKASDWLSPDFRGDISGSINDLGEFASLFGAEPGDFAGKIAIDGTMDARNRRIGGHLTATGNSLSIFKTQIDNLAAKMNLKADELEFEQLEINRKKDFLRAQGKFDIAHDHNYSGKLSAAIGNLSEYLSIFRGPSAAELKPVSAETQITIDSGFWDAHAIVNLADSRPLDITTKFPLKIGQDWKTFLVSPVNVTIDFPAIFLSKAPQIFHPEIFNDGILSGRISLSETLQHPRVVGDLQLLNARLQNAPLDLTQASGRLTFAGDHATIDFFNAATKDVDLSVRGEIDFRDSTDIVTKVFPSMPVFDLKNILLDCASQIKLAPVGITLAPMIDGFEFRGDLFGRNWTLRTEEAQAPDAVAKTTREFRLCLGTGSEQKPLVFGLHSKPKPEAVRPRKRTKRH